MKKIMKWMHRGGALLLIAAMLFTQSGIVSLAEETGSVITIASAEDLVLLADSGKTENFSTGKTFVMTEDIDLSEYENLFIPIMDGTFDGGGHTTTASVFRKKCPIMVLPLCRTKWNCCKPDGRGNGEPVGKIRKTSVSLLGIIKERSVAAPAAVH